MDEVVVFLDLGHVMGGESKSGGVGCGARLRGQGPVGNRPALLSASTLCRS